LEAATLLDAVALGSLLGLDPRLAAAIVGGFFAAIATSLGSLAALALPASSLNSERSLSAVLDVGMGFSSGVMIVASFTSLLLPAINSGGLARALAGFTLGAVVIHIVNETVPHEHIIKGYEGPRKARDLEEKILASWLVAMAVIIHNIPEGMTIGSASAYKASEGLAVSIAIGVQDIPEGLAVSLPLLAATGSRRIALALGVLSGFSEMAVAIPTAMLGVVAAKMLPYLLGFGAGAMVYVVSHEAIPESHRSGHEGKATLGFFIGFILMLALDTALG
jgi:ZIP family zinc transporter